MPQRPQADELRPYQADYVALVPEDDIVAVLRQQIEQMQQLVLGITPEQESFRYAAGKWSVRQIFGHLGDAERIFGYRALCIARGNVEPLPQFDENLFVETASFDQRGVSNLFEEWLFLRRANLSLFESIDDSAWTSSCLVSGAQSTTRAVAWVTAGHLRHHLVILGERYGM